MTQPFPPYESYQPHPLSYSSTQDEPTYVDLAPSPGERSAPPRRPIGMWRTVWVVGVALLACAVAAMIGAVAASGGLRHGDNNLANQTHAQATTAPTATTGSAAPTTANATLGGTLATFEAGYGRPTTITSQGVYFWNAVSLDGHQMTLQFTLATGRDGAPHVSSVTIHVLGAANPTWDTQTAFALAQRFAPADATYIREQTSNTGYLIHFDLSNSLGATFAAVGGGGDDGGGSQAGLFVISCHLSQPGAQTVDRCTLALDTQRHDD